jgi:hypothetical protein
MQESAETNGGHLLSRRLFACKFLHKLEIPGFHNEPALSASN